MLLLKMAIRNLFRHPRRTIITGIAISVGVAVFILTDSMNNPESKGTFLTNHTDGIVVGTALASDLHMEVVYPVCTCRSSQPSSTSRLRVQ